MPETSPTTADDAPVDPIGSTEPTDSTEPADSTVAESPPPEGPSDEAIGVHPAQFSEMATSSPSETELPLARFLDVTLSATVELGSALIPIGDVLKLGEGAVLELDREVTEPVDIMVQGVRLARGEVVIVDNSYAVRITEVESAGMGHVNPSGAGPSHN